MLQIVLGTLITTAGALFLLLSEGGHISSIIQLTAFMMVVLAGIFGMFAVYSLRSQLRLWKLALTKQTGTQRELEDGAAYFQTLGDGVVVTANIGSMLGLIHVMENLSRPEMIGPGLAVALVANLYGIAFRQIVCEPCRSRVTTKLTLLDFNPPDTSKTSAGVPWWGAILAYVSALGIIIMGLLMEGGHLSSTMQTTALIMVLSALFSFPALYLLRHKLVATIVSLGGRGWGDVSDEVAILKSLNWLRGGFVMAGMASALIGLAFTFNLLNRLEMIGPGIAVSSVALMYGILASAVAGTVYCHQWVRASKEARIAHPFMGARGVSSHAFGGVIVLLFALFTVLYALSLAFEQNVGW